ncbi:MAG: hypothetical protein M3281_00795 [Chloroflexota bacterium]|nr:hypothetical protein [Chloroflexota bacterium]
MSRADSLYELPDGLPVPLGDGACNHLPGLRLPFELLSDDGLRLTRALRLPTGEIYGDGSGNTCTPAPSSGY